MNRLLGAYSFVIPSIQSHINYIKKREPIAPHFAPTIVRLRIPLIS